METSTQLPTLATTDELIELALIALAQVGAAQGLILLD
jgi:hypothetical protein